MPDEFPAGVRVLAVDDDFVVLRTMKRLLIKCGYKVTVAHHALEALQLLRANKAAYDLMISDVNMPDMDGFELLDIVGLEMDLPVIKCHEGYKARSSRLSRKKPVRLEELQLIWKHLAKRSFDETKDCGNKLKNLRHIDVCKTHHANRCKELKDDKIEEDSEESEGAVPKKILDIMNVPGLTRENIASHLQPCPPIVDMASSSVESSNQSLSAKCNVFTNKSKVSQLIESLILTWEKMWMIYMQHSSSDRQYEGELKKDLLIMEEAQFILLKISAATLTAEFNSVTVAHHALEALQQLRANKAAYDLMISDVNMPDMDGFELLDIVGLEMDFPVISM
ncbi:hypothetical protein HPP92_015317 [Vanilla planifolia]|uniref:Response regulatory domain-containing protein n=1 Tax=Vanilla planifolia TaxID=51239 RepID=A0A835UXQ4_VANPL|nr:hypothetical protein HPP92_015317 [Vanilla planifolia]